MQAIRAVALLARGSGNLEEWLRDNVVALSLCVIRPCLGARPASDYAMLPDTTPTAPVPPTDSELPPDDSDDKTRRALWRSGDVARGALIVLAVWLGLQLLWSANALVFVVFLGVLFGVAVASGVDRLHARGMRRGIASALLVFGVVGGLGLSVWLMAPTLTTQARELRRDLPAALDKVQALVNKQEFGFLDPFLRTPDVDGLDSAKLNDSAAAVEGSDSTRDVRAGRSAAARPVAVAPPPPPDSLVLKAIESISRAIEDSLQTTLPRSRAVDSALFLPGRPVLPSAELTNQDTVAAATGTLSEKAPIDLAAELEARTNFLRDSLRKAMAANVAEAERRAREELISAGVAAGPREPTRSELLARRVTTGLAGSSRQLFSLVSGTVVVLGSLVMIMFLAIYIGAEPKLYLRWALSVVPARHRASVGVVCEGMAMVLRKWLVTQLVAMIVIGVVSTVALLVLDVRAAFVLGFIAGLLEFVPTIGPVLAAIPAIAMGFVDSPQKALFVLIAYWAIQFLENNLLIPALMRGEMDLPPAITLVAQALMGVLFGFLGLMVAVPLTAAVLVPLRMYAASQDLRERALIRAARDTG